MTIHARTQYRRLARLLIHALFLFACLRPAVFGAEYTWTGTGITSDRNWTTAANWSGTVVPLATDRVIISSTVGPILTSISTTLAGLTFGNTTYACLEMNDSSLDILAGWASAAGATGTAFIVMNDSTLITRGHTNFGGNGTSTVKLHGSSTIGTYGGNFDTGLAQQPTSNSIMYLHDSSVWIAARSCFIGLRGSGTLYMQDNSRVEVAANFALGGNPAGSTAAYGWVDAAGSASVAVASDAMIGNLGTGVMFLRESGTMTVDSNMSIGTAATGTGAMTVADSAVLSVGNALSIGEAGVGSLTLRDGGTVLLGSGTVTLAASGTSRGLLEITGSRGGSIFRANGTDAVTIAAGAGGGAKVLFSHDAPNYTFASHLVGALSVEHTGSGLTTLTGTNNYTGGTVVRGGTLAGTPSSLRGPVTADGAVVFDIAAGTAHTLTLTGSGLFRQTGSGTLTLAVPSAFIGSMHMQGVVNLDNGVTLDTAKSVTLDSGALFIGSLTRTANQVLAGSGTVTGDVSLANSTLALTPGDGPFTIGGNLDFSNSTLMLGIFANSDDIIRVNGTLTSSGVNTIDLSYGMSGTYTLAGFASLAGSTITIGGDAQTAGTRQTATSAASGNDLKILFDADISRLLTWTGSTSAHWNSVDQNWNGSNSTTQFANFDTVVFDGVSDAGHPTSRVITLAGTARLSGMTVSGDADYTFDGSGGISTGTLVITEIGNPDNLLNTTGKLIKTGGGTLTFANTGANTFTGGIEISAGAIVFTDGSQLGTGDAGIAFVGSATLAGAGMIGAVSIVPSATAAFAVDANQALTLSAGLSGGGVLEKTGNGLLSLAGDAGHTGGFIVNAGTLASQGANLRGPVVNNATVILREETDGGVYAGAMSGSGVLIKTGTGSLALTGTITQSNVTIAQGSLALTKNATLNASTALMLSSGALLVGEGTFTTPSFTNRSAIKVGKAANPNNPHGVMTLYGDYNGANGELHLDMSLNAAGVMEYDRFIINGDATGVTHVSLQERPSADRLHGDTSLLPSFGDMVSVGGSTAPGAFVATGMVEFGGGQYVWNPDANDWSVLAIEPASAIGCLDAAALIIGKASLASLGNRLLASREIKTAREKQLWISGFQRQEKLSTLRYDMYDTAPRANADTQGIQAGLDWLKETSEHVFVFGLFADHAKSDLRLPDRASTSSVRSTGGGLYAQWESPRLHIHAMLRQARETYEIGAARVASFDTRGNSWSGLIAAGRDFYFGSNWQMGTEAQFVYQINNVTDATDEAGRHYRVESAASMESCVSVRIAREFIWSSRSKLTPYVRAGWIYDFDGEGQLRVSGDLLRNDFGGGGTTVDFGFAAELGRNIAFLASGAWFRTRSTEGTHLTATFALSW